MSDALTNLLSELRERFAPGADQREVEIWLASGIPYAFDSAAAAVGFGECDDAFGVC